MNQLGRLIPVEFLAIVVLLALFVLLAAGLTLRGVDPDHPIFTALLDGGRTLVGAIIALAYAARGLTNGRGNNNDDDGPPR